MSRPKAQKPTIPTGIDWHSAIPPRNYQPGLIRGDSGFSTSGELRVAASEAAKAAAMRLAATFARHAAAAAARDHAASGDAADASGAASAAASGWDFEAPSAWAAPAEAGVAKQNRAIARRTAVEGSVFSALAEDALQALARAGVAPASTSGDAASANAGSSAAPRDAAVEAAFESMMVQGGVAPTTEVAGILGMSSVVATSVAALAGGLEGERALRLQQDRIRLEPRHPDHYVALSHLHWQRGAPQPALEALLAGVAAIPQHGGLWLLAAKLARRGLGDEVKANQILGDALDALERSPPPRDIPRHAYDDLLTLFTTAADAQPTAARRAEVLERAVMILPSADALWDLYLATQPTDKHREIVVGVMKVLRSAQRPSGATTGGAARHLVPPGLWLRAAGFTQTDPSHRPRLLDAAVRDNPESAALWVARVVAESEGQSGTTAAATEMVTRALATMSTVVRGGMPAAAAAWGAAVVRGVSVDDYTLRAAFDVLPSASSQLLSSLLSAVPDPDAAAAALDAALTEAVRSITPPEAVEGTGPGSRILRRHAAVRAHLSALPPADAERTSKRLLAVAAAACRMRGEPHHAAATLLGSGRHLLASLLHADPTAEPWLGPALLQWCRRVQSAVQSASSSAGDEKEDVKPPALGFAPAAASAVAAPAIVSQGRYATATLADWTHEFVALRFPDAVRGAVRDALAAPLLKLEAGPAAVAWDLPTACAVGAAVFRGEISATEAAPAVSQLCAALVSPSGAPSLQMLQAAAFLALGVARVGGMAMAARVAPSLAAIEAAAARIAKDKRLQAAAAVRVRATAFLCRVEAELTAHGSGSTGRPWSPAHLRAASAVIAECPGDARVAIVAAAFGTGTLNADREGARRALQHYAAETGAGVDLALAALMRGQKQHDSDAGHPDVVAAAAVLRAHTDAYARALIAAAAFDPSPDALEGGRGLVGKAELLRRAARAILNHWHQTRDAAAQASAAAGQEAPCSALDALAVAAMGDAAPTAGAVARPRDLWWCCGGEGSFAAASPALADAPAPAGAPGAHSATQSALLPAVDAYIAAAVESTARTRLAAVAQTTMQSLGALTTDIGAAFPQTLGAIGSIYAAAGKVDRAVSTCGRAVDDILTRAGSNTAVGVAPIHWSSACGRNSAARVLLPSLLRVTPAADRVAADAVLSLPGANGSAAYPQWWAEWLTAVYPKTE